MILKLLLLKFPNFTFVGDETAVFVDYSTSGASGRYNAQTRMLEINSDTDADVDAEIQLQNLVAENLDTVSYTHLTLPTKRIV